MNKRNVQIINYKSANTDINTFKLAYENTEFRGTIKDLLLYLLGDFKGTMKKQWEELDDWRDAATKQIYKRMYPAQVKAKKKDPEAMKMVLKMGLALEIVWRVAAPEKLS